MPSLRVGGRQLSLASDDLPFPAGLVLLCHLALASLSVAVLCLSLTEARQDHALTAVYTSCLLAITVVECAVEVAICTYGCRGARDNVWWAKSSCHLVSVRTKD